MRAVRAERDRLRPAAVPVARAARGRASARVPVHRPPRRRRAAGSRWRPRRSRWPAAPRSPRCLRRPGRRCCRGRPGRSRTARPRPRTSTSSGTCATSRSRSGRSRWRCCRCARPAPPTGARSCSRTSTDCASRGHFRPPSTTRGRGGVVRVPGPVAGHAAARRGAGRGLRGLLPGRSRPAGAATGSRPRPGRSTSPRTPPRSSGSPRRRGSATSPRASIATPRRARCARCRRRIPPASSAGDLTFAGEVLPAFGTTDRERDLAVLFQSHRGDPAWDAWQVAYAQGASGHARRDHSLPGGRGAGGLAAHHARLRRAREPARSPRRARASGRPAARPGTARCSPPRWPRSCGSPACRRASPRDSPRAISAAASTT